MAERGGEPARASAGGGPFPSERRGWSGRRGAGEAPGLVRDFDLVKITTSYVVQTLQEMVSPDPQIIVVAPGAEPDSTQVQRTEDGGIIIRIFWVGPKGELLRRTPVSSVMQVGFERCFPPCSSLPGQAQPQQAPRLAPIRAWPGRPSPGTAPGGRRSYTPAPARHRGALRLRLPRLQAPRLLGQVEAVRRARSRGFLLPLQLPAGLGDPRPGAEPPAPSLLIGRPLRVAPGCTRTWDTAHLSRFASPACASLETPGSPEP